MAPLNPYFVSGPSNGSVSITSSSPFPTTQGAVTVSPIWRDIFNLDEQKNYEWSLKILFNYFKESFKNRDFVKIDKELLILPILNKSEYLLIGILEGTREYKQELAHREQLYYTVIKELMNKRGIPANVLVGLK